MIFLFVFSDFSEYRTISSPVFLVTESGAYAGLLLGSPASLYAFLILNPNEAWFEITMSVKAADLGFLEFTRFALSRYRKRDRKFSHLLYHWATSAHCCGGGIWTHDLQVMGLASCQLLYPAIMEIIKIFLCACLDSNQGPPRYKLDALPAELQAQNTSSQSFFY